MCSRYIGIVEMNESNSELNTNEKRQNTYSFANKICMKMLLLSKQFANEDEKRKIFEYIQHQQPIEKCTRNKKKHSRQFAMDLEKQKNKIRYHHSNAKRNMKKKESGKRIIDIMSHNQSNTHTNIYADGFL